MSETVLDRWERYIAQGGLTPSVEVFSALLRLARAAEKRQQAWRVIMSPASTAEQHAAWRAYREANDEIDTALARLLEPAG